MPPRSLGCANCVKRKIRCDRRPGGCKRCEIHNVQCPGYKPESGNGFIFKDMSAYTQNEANKSYARIQHKNSLQRINYRVGTLVQTADGVTNGFSTANAQRMALHNEFLQSYLPRQNSASTWSPNPLSFMEILSFHSPAHQNSALQPALDALGLVQLGSIAKDERLLKSAVALYGKALSRLGNDLLREDLRHSDDVLASTIVLSICELYEEISQNNGGWVKHIDGTNQILRMRGPKNIKSELALALYANARNSALMQGLISRKASYMQTPHWRSVGLRHGYDSASSAFYDSAIQVPGLLERCDLLRAAPLIDTGAIDVLLNDLVALETTMREWLAGWESSFGAEGDQLRMLRPIKHFVHFSTRCPDRTCARAYHFPSFHVGYLQSLYWMCMHALRTCVQQIAALRHEIDSEWQHRSLYKVTEDELTEYVLDLCRCIPFFCEPLSGSIGHIAIFLPMRVIATYFGPRGKWEWLKWIGAVKATIFTQGLSPPIVGRPVFPIRTGPPSSPGSGSSTQSGTPE